MNGSIRKGGNGRRRRWTIRMSPLAVPEKNHRR